MKPTLKDYLSIILALLAIFLCGYGIGFLFGERKGIKNALPPPPPAPTRSISDWEASTLEVLQGKIDLTPEQLEQVTAEIAKSATKIRSLREERIRLWEAEARDLDRRIQPILTPEQRKNLAAPPPKE